MTRPLTLGSCRSCSRPLGPHQIRYRWPPKPGVTVQRVRVRCSCGEVQVRHASVETTA